MFGLFKKKSPVAQFKPTRVPVATQFVRRHAKRSMKDHAVGSAMCLELIPEVQQWCANNNIKVGRVFPHAIFGEMPLGPFSVDLNCERDAVLFKMKWHIPEER